MSALFHLSVFTSLELLKKELVWPMFLEVLYVF